MMAVSYHNTTAHYNAYFIANQKIMEIERSIEEAEDHDYDQVLNVLQPLDSMISVTYADQIEIVLKKSSLIVQNHPNSKWVDDGYNLVGLARLYGYEYTHAIETFKWVNTNSKNDDTRHTALINLMRTFIEYEEMNNAIAVSDYLQKEKLNRDNLKKLNMMRAWYYQNIKDYNNMVKYLVQSTDNLKTKDNKAKVYFIIGQLYQEQGFESEAFSNYKKCLGSNPEYELSFYARLSMARVSNLENTRDIKNIRKDFKKLVKDAKNKEFVDRIYYEWGSFELRQGNLEEGIEMFNLSVQSGLNNPRQKGRSYLMLGQIYYDSLRNYSMAKSYYDSTIQVLPSDFDGYEDIKSRQEVLDDFITQLNTISLQDSLLALSKLDSSAISDVINLQIENEVLLAKKEEEKKNRKSNVSNTGTNSIFETTGIGEGAGSWYFSNPASLAIGQSEFLRSWGNRPLEDHWRRSVKTNQNIDSPQDDNPDVNNEEEINTEEEVPVADNTEARFASLYKTIPFTTEARQEVHAKIEDAMFRLGNIYYFDLKEEDNATTTFEDFLSRYDPSEYSPEVLYQLYLLYSDKDPAKAELLKSRLLNEYPESSFSKELINPDYQKESLLANEILVQEYQKAYRLFERGEYNAADSTAQLAISTYPDGEFVPRLELLQILIIGKTQDLFRYQFQLGEFIEKYPEEEITDYATKLLDASEKYKEGLIKLKDAQFIVEEKEEHYFLVIYEQAQPLSEQLITQIEEFNKNQFASSNLKTGTLKLDQTNAIILVDKFNDQKSALYYFDLWQANNSLDADSPNLKFDTFVISKNNFQILYKTKELDTYRSFYSLHY